MAEARVNAGDQGVISPESSARFLDKSQKRVL